MANWTKSDLKTQFNRAKANGWIGTFISAALKYKFPPEILLAIASRESNIVNKRGDFRGGKYRGYGIMQLDIGSHKEWIESGAWKDPNLVIHKGTEALWQKRREVANYYKNDKRKWTEHDLLRTAIASYNHGSKDSYHDLKARNNPDEDTTGHDYSTDVLKRAEVFKELLATLNLGEPVISNDISDLDSATPTPAETSVSPSTVQSGTVSPVDGPPAKPGEPAPDVPAKSDEAVVGGRPGDPAIQASTGGVKSLWTTVSTGVLGVAGAIKAYMAHDIGLAQTVVICVTIVVVIFLFRQLITDAIRMWAHMEPNKYNVK